MRVKTYCVQYEPTIDQTKLYTEISRKFLNVSLLIFKVNLQVYFNYSYVAEFSVLVLNNILAGKCLDLVEICPPNFLAGSKSNRKSLLIIMCAMNFYDYPKNLKQKYVQDDSVHNFFGQLLKN